MKQVGPRNRWVFSLGSLTVPPCPPLKLYPCHEAHVLLTQKKEPSAPKDQSKISGGPKKGTDSSLCFLTKFWSSPVTEIGFGLPPSVVGGPPICQENPDV